MVIKTFLAGALLTLSAASTAQAGWSVDGAQSSIYFVSIKKVEIGEVHTFKSLQGALDDNGNVNLTIDLNSVASGIDIRDERMKQMLFETAQFPQASLTAKVDKAALTALKPGATLDTETDVNISLHGQNHTMKTALHVVALIDGSLEVSTVKPAIINAGDYGLIKGINQLAEVAKLPSIATAIPVTVKLVFKR